MRGIIKRLLVIVSILFSISSAVAQTVDLKVDCPRFVFNDSEITIGIKLQINEQPFEGETIILVDDKTEVVSFKEGKGFLTKRITKTSSFKIEFQDVKITPVNITIKKFPSFLTIIPPLVAILLAILFKEVITALFIGIFIGVVFFLGLDDPLNWLKAPFVFIHHYVIKVVSNADKMSVIVFSMLIGGMVNLLMKNGSMGHLVQKLTKFITSRRRSLFSTWILGILIFFDDYANTLVVGNSVRPLTDKFKVSREKLAYIVDSTAAPVASIALITTWIGAQINYISDAVIKLGIDENPYMIFLNSLEYAFYPILTLFFIAVLIYTKRDFGPMFKYEKLALKDFKQSLKIHESNSQKVEHYNPKKQTSRWYDAVIPILSLMVIAFITLTFYTGSEQYWNEPNQSFWVRFMNVIGSSDPYKALLYASIFGLMVALVFTLFRRNIGLKKSVDAVIGGFKTMLIAMIILILAWSLGLITEDLGTDVFLAEVIGKNISPYAISALVFVVSAAIAFATGSSWGTMALLYPIILPMTYASCVANGLGHHETMPIFYMVVSGVLGGSVFGDHCSPISDTTILSSMASQCNHIQHVRTQMPYALTVGVVSILIGYLSISYLKISPIWGLITSALMLLLIIRFFGKKQIETA